MAKVVETFKYAPRSKYHSRVSKYDVYMDGQVWELARGVDYRTAKVARNTIFAAAKKRGVKVRMAMHDGGASLLVQAVP